jgi:hypothetical protein
MSSMASFGEYLPVGMGGSFMVWYTAVAGVTVAGEVAVPLTVAVAFSAVVSATAGTWAVEVVGVDDEAMMMWSGWPWSSKRTEKEERTGAGGMRHRAGASAAFDGLLCLSPSSYI